MTQIAHFTLLAVLTFALGRNDFHFAVLIAIALLEKSSASIVALCGIYLSCLMVRGFFGQTALEKVKMPSTALVLMVLFTWAFVILYPGALNAGEEKGGDIDLDIGADGADGADIGADIGAEELDNAVFTIRKEPGVDDSSLVASLVGAAAPFFAPLTAFLYGAGLISLEQRISSAETPVTRSEVKALLNSGEAEPFWTRLVFAKKAWGVDLDGSGDHFLVFGAGAPMPGLVDVYFSDGAIERAAAKRVQTHVLKRMVFAGVPFEMQSRSILVLRDESDSVLFRGEGFAPVGAAVLTGTRRFDKLVSTTHVAILSFPLFTPFTKTEKANNELCYLFEI